MSPESPQTRSTRDPPSDQPRLGVLGIVVIVVLSATLAAVVFSVTYTAAHDGRLRPYLSGIGVLLVAILLLAGFATPKSLTDSPLNAFAELLPRFSNWASADRRRALSVIAGSIMIGTLSIWIGAASIETISVACDDATSVAIGGAQERVKCEEAHHQSLWRSVLFRSDGVFFRCFDAKGNAWDRVASKDAGGSCGKRPRAAHFVANGIGPPATDTETFAGARTATRVNELRKALAASVPERKFKDILLIAT